MSAQEKLLAAAVLNLDAVRARSVPSVPLVVRLEVRDADTGALVEVVDFRVPAAAIPLLSC
jgi:hypothetical protein